MNSTGFPLAVRDAINNSVTLATELAWRYVPKEWEAPWSERSAISPGSSSFRFWPFFS